MIRKFSTNLLTIIEELKGKLQGQAEDKSLSYCNKKDNQMDFAPTRPYLAIKTKNAYLKVIDSPYKGDQILGTQRVLLKPGFLVGRGISCYLILADPNASRVHASFSKGKDGWLVKDNSSTNGTLLNGQIITNASLQTGDQIQIGQTVLIYEER